MPGCRLSTEDIVRDLVTLIDRAADHTVIGPQQAVLVRIDRLPPTADDEVQFSLKRLPPGVHPLAVLSGFVAPPTWAGIGIVASGRARSLDDPSQVVGRARVVTVVTRDGTTASALRVEGLDPHIDVGKAGTGVLGEIPLALCRAIGVPCRGAPGDGEPEGDIE